MNFRVLLVDDDHFDRELAAEHFDKIGLECLTFEDGPAMLAWLREPDCPGADLALIDLHMPKMNGVQLARMLREEFPSLSLWAYSGAAPPEDDTFDGYLSKGSPDVSATVLDALKSAASAEERRATLRNVSVGLLISNDKGVVVECNQVMLDIAGYDDLIGKPVKLLVPESHKAQHDEYVHHAAGSGLPTFMRLTERYIPLQRKDGSSVECDIRIQRTGDEFVATVIPRPIGVMAVAHPKLITHLLSMELSCTADVKTGVFKYLTPNWTAITGYSHRELRSKPFVEFVHPEDLESTIREAQALMDSGHRTASFQNRYVCKDGSIVYLQWKASSDGKTLFATARDVTNVVSLESQLHNWLQVASGLRVVSEGSSEIEPGSRQFIEVSDDWHRLLGWTSVELTTQPWVNFVHPDDLADTSVEVLRLDEGLPVMRFQNRYRHKYPDVGGNTRWVWLEWRALLHEESQQVFATAWDITAHKELQQQSEGLIRELRQANKDLESFASAAAHQLKSPPRAIAGLAELLLDDDGPTLNEDERESLTMIVSEAERMNGVVAGLHQFSRMQQAEVNLIPVSLIEVVTKAHARVPGLKAEFPVEDVQVLAEPGLLYEVIYNLLTNAEKYNESEIKTARWSWVEQDRMVEVCLADNGIGMDPSLIEKKLFKLFERLHPLQGYEGHGVGLAMARHVVAKMGGQIRASSEGEGTGSTFCLTLKGASE